MTRLEKDLAALAMMSPVQLRARWEAAARAPAPNVPPALLRRLLAQHLQEKRHGGLPLLVMRELERAASPSAQVLAPARKDIPLTPAPAAP